MDNGTILGPSDGALSGSGCVSIKTAATPTATAALARVFNKFSLTTTSLPIHLVVAQNE